MHLQLDVLLLLLLLLLLRQQQMLCSLRHQVRGDVLVRVLDRSWCSLGY
jgi:hypothetical protein